MAPLPPLIPPPSPEPAGAKSPLRTRPEVPEESFRQSTAGLIYVKLRKMIASDTQPTEAILGAIAVAAHSLTGASGAAVAMPRDGEVVCVGRSGETAPELGHRLNVDSGISGECLRTGVTMRCDDASRDLHVDAEVCRELGLQSIAVVPLRGQLGRVGVLEAFSTESYAFSPEKMEILERLAGLAEAAWARGMVTEVASGARSSEVPYKEVGFEDEGAAVSEAPSAIAVPAELPLPAVELVPLAQVREALAPGQPEHSSVRRRWTYVVLASVALVAVALLSVYGWKAWYRSSLVSTARPPAAAAVTVHGVRPEGEDISTGVGSVSTPDLTLPSSPPSESAAVAKPTPATVASDEVIRRVPRSAGQDRRARPAAKQSAPAPDGDEIPQIAAARTDRSDLEKALLTAPALPELDVPISQGTAGGVLVHKVRPVYPPDARRMGVEGDVVIDAVVTVEGKVGDLKLVSGNPLLTAAAMDAVRRWRYTPYLLNGKPIPKPTRITISFIAPQ